MLSVLLVDDEVRTLHHLKTAVPWDHLGMEVIGTAENGLDALDFIEAHAVDLLITDIRMPGMDGLELCSEELSAGIYTHQIPFVDASFEGPDSFLAIMNYLNTHYEQAITLKSVAEDLHLNASYISQLIKAETGLTYTQYITELRIGKAKELLTHTKLSLAEISEAVGFNDYFYFIKKFKKEVEVTPGKYL
jgi:YesN/AraC family two-component response regulator